MNSSTPTQPSPKILWTHFRWTVDRFEEILKNEKSDYYRDASLQRFTFTFDTACKLICSLAVEKAMALETLPQYFQWAEENQWLTKDAHWRAMIQSHNLAARKLKDEQADREYEKLAAYCSLLKSLCDNLSGVVENQNIG